MGRGWPRLAEAGGRPALALVLAGRIGRGLWAAGFHKAWDEVVRAQGLGR